MTLSFDLYFSFRSPFSYLAVERISKLRADYHFTVALKVVRPIAVRIPGFFERADPLRARYIVLDAKRCAEELGIPYRWPRPDPIVMDRQTGKVDAEQPYIYGVTRMGLAAAEQGRGFELALEAARKIWSGRIDDWHEGDHLADAAARAGLDFETLRRTAEDEAERLDAVATGHEAEQRAAGHWGVPLMVFEGEPFFGQDRVEQLMWRMRQRGLAAH